MTVSEGERKAKKAPSGVVESVCIIMEMKLTQRHQLDALRLAIVIHRTDISAFSRNDQLATQLHF